MDFKKVPMILGICKHCNKNAENIVIDGYTASLQVVSHPCCEKCYPLHHTCKECLNLENDHKKNCSRYQP